MKLNQKNGGTDYDNLSQNSKMIDEQKQLKSSNDFQEQYMKFNATIKVIPRTYFINQKEIKYYMLEILSLTNLQ